MDESTPRVLVVYASKMGATAGIAEWVGETLREAGLDADVAEVTAVKAIDDYDAVIVGSALYMGRWRRTARRFARRHRAALRERPVWLFSSGPLDDSAAREEAPATTQVAAIASSLAARGHATFGGAMPDDATGAIARTMVRNGLAGDFRDPEHVSAWARDVADALTAAPTVGAESD